MKRFAIILLASLCFMACSEIRPSTTANVSSISAPPVSSSEIRPSTTENVSSISASPVSSSVSTIWDDYPTTVIASFIGENRHVKRIDVKDELIGVCAYIVFNDDVDWNSLTFNERGEMALETLLYTYDVLEENDIGFVSAAGYLEDVSLLFSLTDGLGNIIIWDVGQEDYSYGAEDVYMWNY